MTTAAGGLLGPPDARAGVDAPPPGNTEIELLHGERPELATFEDPRVLLFCVNSATAPERLRDLLAAAWDLDPGTTLKLICNLRGVRGTGKGDREGFYTAALWLHKNHPKALACNLSAFADFGYIKDLPELLYRLVNGPDARKVAILTQLASGKRGRSADPVPAFSAALPPLADVVPAVLPVAAEVEEPVDQAMQLVHSQNVDIGVQMATPAASDRERPLPRSRKVVDKAMLARAMYNTDANYSYLFDRIVEFFADRLSSDLNQLRSGNKSKIGLAAKWCPSVGSSFDQALLLCEAIARRLFPQASKAEYGSLTVHQYTYRVLRRLRREVLVPLRAALQLPENYMCNQQWSELPYNRVASEAMKRYSHIFEKHDKDRFENYLSGIQSYKSKITFQLADGTVLPHKLAVYLEKGAKVRDSRKKEVRQSWMNLVEGLRANGLFSNSLAVCDVLGNNKGLHMAVAVALSVLVSELSEAPWMDWVHPFSETCKAQLLSSKAEDKIHFLHHEMKKFCNNKFHLGSVFDWILAIAGELKIKPEKMVKTIFVFTNKDFEEASSRLWKADYRTVRDNFHRAGYRDVVPQVVLWNLQGKRSAALTSTKDGIITISGFSNELMKLFLEKGGVVEPEDEMYAAIAGNEYNVIRVTD